MQNYKDIFELLLHITFFSACEYLPIVLQKEAEIDPGEYVRCILQDETTDETHISTSEGKGNIRSSSGEISGLADETSATAPQMHQKVPSGKFIDYTAIEI